VNTVYMLYEIEYSKYLFWLMLQAKCGHHKRVDTALMFESRCILLSVCCWTDF